MEKTKVPFFKRVKNAITNFDAYSDFAVEKMSIAIKYYAKLMVIFSIILSICFCYKFSTVINNEEQVQIMYNQFEDNGLDIKLIDEAINYIKSNNSSQFYIALALSVTFYVFSVYFLMGFIDIFLISIFGIIVSRLARIILKYKPIFIMSIYALTLPIILNCIYIVANTLTGFTIDYFAIVYNVIAYIYIVTAILMIKTDFMEQQTELIKILQEQERIKQEQEREKKKEQEENKPKEEPKGDKKEDTPPAKEPTSEPE